MIDVLHKYECVHVCVFLEVRRTLGVFLSAFILRRSLSVNLKLTDFARLTDQGAAGTHLLYLPTTQH